MRLNGNRQSIVRLRPSMKPISILRRSGAAWASRIAARHRPRRLRLGFSTLFYLQQLAENQAFAAQPNRRLALHTQTMLMRFLSRRAGPRWHFAKERVRSVSVRWMPLRPLVFKARRAATAWSQLFRQRAPSVLLRDRFVVRDQLVYVPVEPPPTGANAVLEAMPLAYWLLAPGRIPVPPREVDLRRIRRADPGLRQMPAGTTRPHLNRAHRPLSGTRRLQWPPRRPRLRIDHIRRRPVSMPDDRCEHRRHHSDIAAEENDADSWGVSARPLARVYIPRSVRHHVIANVSRETRERGSTRVMPRMLAFSLWHWQRAFSPPQVAPMRWATSFDVVKRTHQPPPHAWVTSLLYAMANPPQPGVLPSRTSKRPA